MKIPNTLRIQLFFKSSYSFRRYIIFLEISRNMYLVSKLLEKTNIIHIERIDH